MSDTTNVRIKTLEIGIETGVTLRFDDPEGILAARPYFSVPHNPVCRSEAESLGWRILALCWVLDHWHHLHVENEVVRIGHQQGHVTMIGNAVLERWLGNSGNGIPIPHLTYPFYSGVPVAETPAA